MYKTELLILLLLAILVRLPWLFTVPMQEAPDEFAHWWVVEFVRTHWALPGYNEIMSAGPSGVYGSLPQLGYLPHIFISALFPASESTLYSRFGSLLAGLVTVWQAYLIGVELFAAERFLRLAFACLIVFHPQLVFVHSYTNNDATAGALCSMIYLILIRLIKYGLSRRRAIIIGILLGLLALCKYTGATVAVVAVLAVVSSARLHRCTRSLTLTCLSLVVVVPMAVSGWWFLRNSQVFSGDFLGTRTMYDTWADTFGRQKKYYLSPWSVIKQKQWWSGIFYSFWGLFGYMNRFLPSPVYILYLAFMIASLLGWLKAGLEKIRESSLKLVPDEEFVTYGLMAIAVALNVMAVIWASTGNLGGPQGRYLFPSEIPIMLLTVAGLRTLGGKAYKYSVGGFAVFNASVAIGAWIMLFLLYGFHARPY